MNKNNFDVIIIGGSYAGLSAAMALGRSLRKVLILDTNKPCNRQTPHSHNFITHDGDAPMKIASLAKAQVLKYATVTLKYEEAITAQRNEFGFEVQTTIGNIYSCKKLIWPQVLKM